MLLSPNPALCVWRATMTAFVAPLKAPLIAFVSALLGAFMAWAWFAGRQGLAALCAGVLLIAGAACLSAGAAALPGRPTLTVRLMNQSVLAYVGLLAVAAAAAIVVSVGLVAESDADEETKKLLAAVTTAVTTFLGAVFVAGDKSEAAIGEVVKSQFLAHYGRAEEGQVPEGQRYLDVGDKRLFPPDSDAVNALFSDGWHDLTGWEGLTRLKRAQAIQAYMTGAG